MMRANFGGNQPPREVLDAIRGIMNEQPREPEGEVSFEHLAKLFGDLVDWKQKEFDLLKLQAVDHYEDALKHINTHEKQPKKLKRELGDLIATFEGAIETIQQGVLKGTVDRKISAAQKDLGADELIKKLMGEAEEEVGDTFDRNKNTDDESSNSEESKKVSFGFGNPNN